MSQPEIPQAWADLIEGLTLLAKHPASDVSPLWCEHDILHVCVELDEFSGEEVEQLEALGFHADYNDGGFLSTRFGST